MIRFVRACRVPGGQIHAADERDRLLCRPTSEIFELRVSHATEPTCPTCIVKLAKRLREAYPVYG